MKIEAAGSAYKIQHYILGPRLEIRKTDENNSIWGKP